jgi:hypothetical protein
MKKLILAFAFSSIASIGYTQSCSGPIIAGNTECWRMNMPHLLDFPFYFQPVYSKSILRLNEHSLFLAKTYSPIYSGFEAMHYKFPEAAIFCRMENACTKRFGFMFSIHAGGYSER